MRPLYIFDLDGTLCNIEHRLHFLKDVTDANRWKKFYRASSSDRAVLPVIAIMSALMQSGADVWIWTGRSAEVRTQTEMWLHVHTDFTLQQLQANPELLIMRGESNRMEDHDLKARWLARMEPDDRERLVCVFEDRQRVVDMWRNAGVTCVQVAPGDF